MPERAANPRFAALADLVMTNNGEIQGSFTTFRMTTTGFRMTTTGFGMTTATSDDDEWGQDDDVM
jgi:hypothetical protein